MPRLARLDAPGVLHHIMIRGIEGREIFLNNKDREDFLDRLSNLLAEKVERGELGVKTGKGWHDYTGKSIGELLKDRDRKLLRQLIIFNENQRGKNDRAI